MAPALRLAVPLIGALAAAATGAAAAFAMDGGPRQHLSEQTGLKLCKSGQIERQAAARAGAQQFVLRSGPRDACKRVVARSLARAASDQCPDPSMKRGGCAFGFGARTVTVIRYERGRGRSDRYLVRTS
jgi:hypothetical protein